MKTIDKPTTVELKMARKMGDTHHRHGLEKGRPAYYRCPLISRAAIAAYLERVSINGARRYGYFSFNVKLYNLDLDFDHLLEIHRRDNVDSSHPLYTDQAYIDLCRAKYNEDYDNGKDTNDLFEWAVDEARRSVTDDDTNRTLWNGEISVKLSFDGRSGGWLVVDKFEGIAMDSEFDPADEDKISYNTLRKLYEYIVMLGHDFGDNRPEKEVEYQAAFAFFENICRKIAPTKDLIGAGI